MADTNISVTNCSFTNCSFGGGVVPPAFSPLDLTSIYTYLRSNIDVYKNTGLSSPATQNGDTVAGWTNQVSGGSPASAQQGATYQSAFYLSPEYRLAMLNSQPALAFDGVDDYMALGTATTYNFIHKTGIFYIVFLLRLDYLAPSQAGLLGNLNSSNDIGFEIYVDNTGAVKAFITKGSATQNLNLTSSGTVTLGTWTAVELYGNGTSCNVALNYGSPTNASYINLPFSTSDATRLTALMNLNSSSGLVFPSDSALVEFIVTQATPSSGERTSMKNYFNTTYNTGF